MDMDIPLLTMDTFPMYMVDITAMDPMVDSMERGLLMPSMKPKLKLIPATYIFYMEITHVGFSYKKSFQNNGVHKYRFQNSQFLNSGFGNQHNSNYRFQNSGIQDSRFQD